MAKSTSYSVTMMMTIDILDRKFKDADLNDNEREIFKLIFSANCSIKSATQFPEKREEYLAYCRDRLEQALIYLDEEIDNNL